MGSNENNTPNQIAGALTYPSGSSGSNLTPMPQQPRQPRDLQQLLHFAMAATTDDTSGNLNVGPMDEERRRFLEEAFKGMTINIAEVIEQALKVLTDQERIKSLPRDAPLPEDVATAFDNILELIYDMDVANDFYKMGGFAIFPIAYGSENQMVRARASTVIGELVQNNPYCQEKILNTGVFNVISRLLETEKGESLAKCLFAVSSSTRGYEEAIRVLEAEGGFTSLAKLLTTADTFSKAKTAFLIGNLCREDDIAKQHFIKLNIIKTIVEELKKERDRSTEHMLNILITMTKDMTPTVLSQFMDPSITLREVLENHLKHPDLEGGSCQEEKEYCEQLIKCLFIDKPNVTIHEEAADRYFVVFFIVSYVETLMGKLANSLFHFFKYFCFKVLGPRLRDAASAAVHTKEARRRITRRAAVADAASLVHTEVVPSRVPAHPERVSGAAPGADSRVTQSRPL